MFIRTKSSSAAKNVWLQVILLSCGRGEISRLSFAAANIEFEDIRLEGEAWAKEKACR